MNKLETIYNKFFPLLNRFGQVYIAGGAPRDIILGRKPKDFDFFILPDANPSNEGEKQELIGKIKREINATIEGSGNLFLKEDYYYRGDYEERPVSNVFFPDGEFVNDSVQIMVNFSKDPKELLSTFDWNICLFLYGYFPYEYRSGYFNLESEENIKPGNVLKLNKLSIKNPLNTLFRGVRFSDRYSLTLNKSDIVTISKQIVENDKNKDERVTGVNFMKYVDNGIGFAAAVPEAPARPLRRVARMPQVFVDEVALAPIGRDVNDDIFIANNQNMNQPVPVGVPEMQF